MNQCQKCADQIRNLANGKPISVWTSPHELWADCDYFVSLSNFPFWRAYHGLQRISDTADGVTLSECKVNQVTKTAVAALLGNEWKYKIEQPYWRYVDNRRVGESGYIDPGDMDYLVLVPKTPGLFEKLYKYLI